MVRDSKQSKAFVFGIFRSRQPPELWAAPVSCCEGSQSEWHGGRSVRRRGRHLFRWQVSPHIVSLLFQATKGAPALTHSFWNVTQLAVNRFERQQIRRNADVQTFLLLSGWRERMRARKKNWFCPRNVSSSPSWQLFQAAWRWPHTIFTSTMAAVRKRRRKKVSKDEHRF